MLFSVFVCVSACTCVCVCMCVCVCLCVFVCVCVFSNFKDWMNDASDNNSIAGYHLRSRPTQAKTITVYNNSEVKHHAEYYFVVANPQYSRYIQPRVEISLSRSLYNVSEGYASRCAVSYYVPYCEGSLDNSSLGVVVVVNSSHPETNINLSYSGVPRVSSYILITMVPFALITAFFSLVGLRYYRQRRNASSPSRPATTTVTRTVPRQPAVPAWHGQQGLERAPLLDHRSSASYAGQGLSTRPSAPPPDPPSYEEATA